MFKNTSGQKLMVFAFDATTSLPKTGDSGNITAYVDKDFGGVNALTDTSATEKDATNATGYYLFDLSQSETNADCLQFSAKSSTSNIVVIGVPATVFTRPPNFSSLSINSSGIVQSDSAKINGVSTSGVTTVGANIGTTQPINFHGTGSSAYVKSDIEEILSVTAPTSSDGRLLVNAGDVRYGAAQAGGASTITLDSGASSVDNFYQNQVVHLTGGTGGGQSAKITSYVGSTKVATIIGTWATNPDNTTTFALKPDGAVSATVSGSVTVGAYAGGQDPATLLLTNPSNKLATDASGRVDVGSVGGTSQTARDLGASVLLSSGTGTGQVKLSSGYVAPNWGDVGNPTTTVNLSGTSVKTATDVETDTQNLQSRVPASLVSGRMDASVGAYQSGQAPLQPTTAGRTLDVTTTGEAGIDWANVGGQSSTVNLENTTVGEVTTIDTDAIEEALQAVEVEIINPVNALTGDVEVFASIDYNTDTDPLSFSATNWPDLSGGEFDEIIFGVTVNDVTRHIGICTITVASPSGTQTVTVALNHNETLSLVASGDESRPFLASATSTYTLFALKGTSRTVLSQGSITANLTDWA